MSEPYIISTSERTLFRRCRRKWDWQGPSRQNLIAVAEAASSPLWYGSGFHFALEDYHGRKHWPTATDAFDAYVRAFRPSELPPDIDELMELGHGMLPYYTDMWLPVRDEYQTLMVNGEPQVEVSVDIDISSLVADRAAERGIVGRYAPDMWRRPIIYRVTFDRVVVDSEGRLWIVDYKTARQFDVMKLETDSQITTYTWAGRLFYGAGYEVEGVLWMQFRKDVPEPPATLVNGGFSKNKNQNTTYAMYVRALQEKYGVIPAVYRDILAYLAELETPDGDKFIRRDIVRRNTAFTDAEEVKIADEVLDMLDPQLALYPNPTRDCTWECNFRTACLMRDDGSDWGQYLADEYVPWEGYNDSWRSRIVYPSDEEVAVLARS
jgi:hypothetical protein